MHSLLWMQEFICKVIKLLIRLMSSSAAAILGFSYGYTYSFME